MINNHQLRKSGPNDMDQSLSKYSDLLTNILNIQDSNNKLLKENNHNQRKSLIEYTNLMPVRHQSAHCNKTKLKTNIVSKQPNNIKPGGYNKQPILKSIRMIENCATRPHTSAPSSSSMMNIPRSAAAKAQSTKPCQLRLLKSKSAENLNQRSFLSKSATILKKHSFNANDTQIKTSINSNKNNMIDDILEITKDFDDLNDKNFLKLLASFNQKLNIKSENRKVFFAKLINLAKVYQENKETNENNNDKADLEMKLNSMKSEIDQLKLKLAAKSNPTLSTTSDSTSDSSSSSATIDSNLQNFNKKPTDSESFSQMTKQINDLAIINKGLLLEKANMSNSLIGLNHSKMNEESGVIDRLRNELKNSSERCKVLEYLLNQKNKENEQFTQLFKEIGENVNNLINELERNRRPVAHVLDQAQDVQDSAADTKSISVLKENLINFQKRFFFKSASSSSMNAHNFCGQLKCNNNQFINNQQQATPLVINHNHNLNQLNETMTASMFPPKIMTNFKTDHSATTSDTLIDADSSFDSINMNIFRKTSNLNLNMLKSAVNNKTDINSNFKSIIKNLNNDFGQQDSDNISDDDQEGIVIAIEDLSISTMQTSNLTNECSNTNESIANLNMRDEHQFEEGLKMLDQKIYKVKKLLETMKNS